MSKIVWAAMAFAAIGAGVAVAQTAPPSAVPPVPPIADKSIAVPAPMDNTMAKPAPLTDAPAITATTPANTPAIGGSTNPPPAGAPLPGANSFTEAQARQRMEDQGYSGITDLKQDAQSIWRGTARKGGVSMSVALDFQGNVVGGPAPKP